MNVKCNFCEAKGNGSIDSLTDLGWQRAVFYAPQRITITACREHRNQFLYALKYNMMSKEQKEEVNRLARVKKGRGAFLEWKVENTLRRVDICKHCWGYSEKEVSGCMGNNDNCCVVKLFKLTKYASAKKIIEFCCQNNCHHKIGYHNKRCPIHLSGIASDHHLKKQKKEPEAELPEKDDKGYTILRLSDFGTVKKPSKVAKSLFVPLNAEFYLAFERGDKTWELRGIRNQFNEKTVVTGKEVTLSLGYNTPQRLFGNVGEVRIFDTIDEALESDVKEKILPGAIHERAIESMKATLMLNYNRFIAFEVKLKKQR